MVSLSVVEMLAKRVIKHDFIDGGILNFFGLLGQTFSNRFITYLNVIVLWKKEEHAKL